MAANAKRQPLPKWNFWLGLLTCVATVLAFIIGHCEVDRCAEG